MSSVITLYNDIIEDYRTEFPRGTPLVCACEKGRVVDVEDIIRGARAAGMNVTLMVSELGTRCDGDSGWTPLMVAASEEHSDIVKILLDNNADTATTDETGENALYTAFDNETTTTIVRLLLNKMELKDINHKDTSGRVPLDLYYDFNTSPIKQQLIDLIRQKGGKTKSELAEVERINGIRSLPKEKKEKMYNTLINKYEEEFPKGTPLVCACEKGRVEDVEGMIRGARAAGMDVTAMVSELGKRSNGYSHTPLTVSAYYEHSTIIEILLQCNADTATTNDCGSNALHYAALHNETNTTIVQLLLNNMKLEDINHKDTDGDTPLDCCYKYNNSSIKQQLIDLIRQKGGKRASELATEVEITRIRSLPKEELRKLYKTLNEKYEEEFPRGTPLVCACEEGRVEDVEGLIRGARAAGMDVTMVSKVGRSSRGKSVTPLIAAAYYEHSTIIEILLQYNADTATTDKHGRNALHYAAYNETTTTTVRLLLNNMKLEAINHKRDDGDTPLDLCYEWNNSSIKQQLIDLIRQKGGKRAMELPATLEEFYTLDEFRMKAFPIEADRLGFTVLGKDLDCDIGDNETTKYMPVKLDVESEDEDDGGEERENKWDKDGSGKLYLFCAKQLKKYLNTQQGSWGLSTENANTFFEGDLSNQNPFNRNKIVGVQYLTQTEIEEEQKKYAQLNSENNNVEDNRKKIEENNNKKAYADSMELLANNPLLSILQRRLENAQRLLAEEEAKDTANMSEREEELRNVEIVGARNRILDLEQRIRREEQRRLEELKRKNSLPVGRENKRQRKKLYLKLSNLKF